MNRAWLEIKLKLKLWFSIFMLLIGAPWLYHNLTAAPSLDLPDTPESLTARDAIYRVSYQESPSYINIDVEYNPYILYPTGLNRPSFSVCPKEDIYSLAELKENIGDLDYTLGCRVRDNISENIMASYDVQSGTVDQNNTFYVDSVYRFLLTGSPDLLWVISPKFNLDEEALMKDWQNSGEITGYISQFKLAENDYRLGQAVRKMMSEPLQFGLSIKPDDYIVVASQHQQSRTIDPDEKIYVPIENTDGRIYLETTRGAFEKNKTTITGVLYQKNNLKNAFSLAQGAPISGNLGIILQETAEDYNNKKTDHENDAWYYSIMFCIFGILGLLNVYRGKKRLKQSGEDET